MIQVVGMVLGVLYGSPIFLSTTCLLPWILFFYAKRIFKLNELALVHILNLGLDIHSVLPINGLLLCFDWSSSKDLRGIAVPCIVTDHIIDLKFRILKEEIMPRWHITWVPVISLVLFSLDLISWFCRRRSASNVGRRLPLRLCVRNLRFPRILRCLSSTGYISVACNRSSLRRCIRRSTVRETFFWQFLGGELMEALFSQMCWFLKLATIFGWHWSMGITLWFGKNVDCRAHKFL